MTRGEDEDRGQRLGSEGKDKGSRGGGQRPGAKMEGKDEGRRRRPGAKILPYWATVSLFHSAGPLFVIATR